MMTISKLETEGKEKKSFQCHPERGIKKSGILAMSFMDHPLDSIKHRRKKGNSQSTVVKRGSVGVIRNRVHNLFQNYT